MLSYFFVCRRSISAPQIDVIEDETLMVPQDYNMAMREVRFQVHTLKVLKFQIPKILL